MSLLSGRQPAAGPKSHPDPDREDFDREFGNIFDEETTGLVQPAGGEAEYFCVWCEERGLGGRDDARRHYQHHLDYLPILCSLCGQRTADLTDFLKHHTTRHPGVGKGKYKRRQLAHVEKWLNGFLYAQATIVSTFPPREQCPVCAVIFSPEQVASSRPRRSTHNRIIDHVHRHLCYLPYQCVRCKEEDGKEFLVGYFESKAHSHIKLKHPDVDEQESRWFLFQKTITIPQLDDFVSNFLHRFGISVDSERRPVRKSQLSDSSANLVSDDSADEEWDRTLVPVSAYQTAISSEPDAHMVRNPSPSEEIVVNVWPEMLDLNLFDAGSCGLPAATTLPYFCIFCSQKLDTVSQANVHFGAHLDYHPIICLICEQRFDDIETFSCHHKSSHETQTDLHFEVREDFMIEKWIDDFLKFQRSNSMHRMLLPCSCAKFCPTCCKINANTKALTNCSNHDEAFFTDHLKQHLNYVPFVCLICRRNGKSARISNLSTSGATHIHNEHSNLSPETLSRTAKMFSKVLFIQQIEDVIKSNSISRQAVFAETAVQPVTLARHQIPSANSIRDHPTGHYPRSNRIDGMVNMRVITEGNRMVLKQFHPKAPKIVSKSIPQPKIASNHIRIEGGRVVNLPDARMPHNRSSASTHYRIGTLPNSQNMAQARPGKPHVIGRLRDLAPVQHQVLQSPLFQKRDNGDDQARITSSVMAAVPVMCLHCNKLYPSKRLLRLHSNKFHPGLQLTLASASPDARSNTCNY